MSTSDLINNRDRAKQLLAFDNMKYGLCRPTDIDCSIDFQQKCFIFVELKSAGAALTVGQRIHLQGLVDAIVAGGREAYAILAHHDTPDTEHDVMVSEAVVHSLYCGDGGRWERILGNKTVDNQIQELYATYKFNRGK